MILPKDKALALMPNRRATAEHLLPVSRGGGNTIHNVVAACKGCNNERGNMPLWQWVSVLMGRLKPQHVAALLRKLTNLGIKPPIGHLALATPTVENPIVRAPEMEAPAP